MIPITVLALWLAEPGMVAFEGNVEQRLEAGASEFNKKAPFDDGVAILVRATARKRTLALQYRVTAHASVDAARAAFVERSCTAHPIEGLIRDSAVVLTAVFAKPRRRPVAVRVDARSCRILRESAKMRSEPEPR